MKAFLLALSLLALFAPRPTAAQESNTYDPTHMRSGGSEAADFYRSRQRMQAEADGQIVPKTITLDLVRRSYMDDDQFGIEMMVPDVISGCFDISPLEYEAKFVDSTYFDIIVKHYKRKRIEGGAASCPSRNTQPSALIALNKSDLQDKNIGQIRFQAGGNVDYYDVDFEGEALTLTPQSTVVFTPAGGADKLTYRFGPGGAVKLMVPMLKPGDTPANAIQNLARQNALTAIDGAGLEVRMAGQTDFMFYDNSGQVLDRIGGEKYIELGTIEVNRPYDSTRGRAMKATPLKVYAAKP